MTILVRNLKMLFVFFSSENVVPGFFYIFLLPFVEQIIMELKYFIDFIMKWTKKFTFKFLFNFVPTKF